MDAGNLSRRRFEVARDGEIHDDQGTELTLRLDSRQTLHGHHRINRTRRGDDKVDVVQALFEPSPRDRHSPSHALNELSARPYPRANDLVFMAMCRQALGETDLARQLLEDVQALTQDTTDLELLGFVREAERLVPMQADADGG